jgi:predicted negative regulator of RcsB-dependent stress response
MTPLILATSWADSAVGIAATIGVFGLLGVLAWQIFATGRTGITSTANAEYRKLAESVEADQGRTTAALEQLAADVAEIKASTTALERLLKDV